MSLWTRIRRRLCPSCIPASEFHPALSALERTATGMRGLRGEVRRIREEMANDDNPMLGKPPRVPRRKQP